MTDPKRRFSGVALDYARHRPSYPSALIDWIARQARLRPGARVVDVGCGTGISTRLFAARGFDVVGVEPNESMRAQASGAGGTRYVEGEAEATGLPSACADLVCAAQAFHWFRIPEALREFARLARPQGRCCAFWNLRRDTPFLREYARTLRRFSPDYSAQPHGRETLEKLSAWPGLREVLTASFPNRQSLDLAGLLGRAHSTSYVWVGVKDREGFDRALAEVFARHQENGAVAFDYDARAVLWSP